MTHNALPLLLLLLAACSSVPDVTFYDDHDAGVDAAADASGTSATPLDASSTPPPAPVCTPPQGGVCCGTTPCVNCKADRCTSCLAQGCVAPQICCTGNGPMRCVANAAACEN